MTNREWLMSLTNDQLANELLNFASLHKKLMFSDFCSFNVVSKWLEKEHIDNEEIIKAMC